MERTRMKLPPKPASHNTPVRWVESVIQGALEGRTTSTNWRATNRNTMMVKK